MEKANINSQNHFHQIVYDSGLGSDEWDESVGLLAREKADEVWCLREAIGPGWHLCFALPLYTSTLQNTLRVAIGPGWHLQIAIGQALMHEQYLRGEGRTDRLNTFAYLSFDAFPYFSMMCFMSRALSKDCAIYIKREFMQIMAWGEEIKYQGSRFRDLSNSFHQNDIIEGG